MATSFNEYDILSNEFIDSSITIGGNYGSVINVTNLNDNGVGSLRNALTSVTRHYVKIQVSGVITLRSPIVCSSNITVDCPSSYTLTVRGDAVRFMNNSIVRGMRFTNGFPSNTPQSSDALQLWGSNIEVMNCHIYWGADSNLEILGNNIIIRDSIIAEALESYGNKGINITQGGGNVTLLRNIILTNKDRNFTAFSGHRIDMYNNWICNYGQHTNLQPRDSEVQLNLINNKFTPGIFPTSAKQFIIGYINNLQEPNNITYINNSGQYLQGNVDSFYSESVHLPQTDLIQTDSGQIIISVKDTPYASLHIPIETLVPIDENFETFILSSVGTNTGDAWKTRVFNELMNREWTLYVENQDTDAGGY